jgi:hypothetical protein
LGEALCDNPTAPEQQLPASPRCGAPDENGVAGVGDLIGAQNAAVNLLGPVVVIPENHAPTAAADSFSVAVDSPLFLSPADVLVNDFDADGDILSIHSVDSPVGGSVVWNGSNIVFDPTPNFNGPASFNYTIFDGYFINTASVSVTVTPVNDTPMANAGIDQTARLGTVVTLDGGGSSDIDGDGLTYRWSFVSVPPRSRASLSGGTTVNPTFKADKAGAYVLSLIVNDGTVDSVSDTVTITAAKAKK